MIFFEIVISAICFAFSIIYIVVSIEAKSVPSFLNRVNFKKFNIYIWLCCFINGLARMAARPIVQWGSFCRLKMSAVHFVLVYAAM